MVSSARPRRRDRGKPLTRPSARPRSWSAEAPGAAVCSDIARYSRDAASASSRSRIRSSADTRPIEGRTRARRFPAARPNRRDRHIAVDHSDRRLDHRAAVVALRDDAVGMTFWVSSRAEPGNQHRRIFDAAARTASSLKRDRRFADSPLEEAGFELVWGFSCQVVVLGFAESSLLGAGKPFFIPSPAIRFAGQGSQVPGGCSRDERRARCMPPGAYSGGCP